MKKKLLSPFLFLILLSLGFVYVFYGKILLHPNSYLIYDGGDAIKNYFTYASQAHGNYHINSQWMNYPYGENFLFLDCQPVISFIINILSKPFPSIINYNIGIINFLIIFSFILSAIFIYLILDNYHVNRIYSAFSAFSITVLAPQIFRITGHLALSYSFFIPLTWYLFTKFLKSEFKLKWSVLLFINNIFLYFVHAYLGMIAVSFLMVFFILDFIINDRRKYYNLIQCWYVFLQTILPLVLFWSFAILSDNHIGRTKNPYGFLEYTANFYSVFLPHHPPLKPIFERLIGSFEQRWEGWAYIGIGSIITILLFLYINIRNYFRHGSYKIKWGSIKNENLFIALISGIVLLLFSVGLPFKLRMEFLLNWFPIIKNFRGVGRFAWVFYYTITICCVYYLNSIFEHKRKLIYLLLAFLLPMSYLYEGISYHQTTKQIITNSYNLFDRNQVTGNLSDGIPFCDQNKYQAILALPFYDIGSENYGKTATDKIYKISMILSYHSGIPIMGTYSTRTSIPESKNLIQLLSPDFYGKKIQSDIKSDKPFLVIYSKDDLSEYESNILGKCQVIYSNSEYSLLSISKELLFENSSRKEIENFEKIRNQLSKSKGFLTTNNDSNSIILYNSFENSPQKISFRGTGSYKGQMGNYNELADIDINKLKLEKEYLISFWMYNEGSNFGQDALNSMVFINLVDEKNNSQWVSVTNPAYSVVIDDSWSQVEMSFLIKTIPKKMTLYLKGDDQLKKSFFIDDLLIREKGTDVYKVITESKGQIQELLKNNHKIIDGQKYSLTRN